MRKKLSELHCNVLLLSNLGEKVMKSFLNFLNLLPWIGEQKISKYGSESFPRMVTYILCVENCQNYILMHSCLPILGRLF